MFSCYWDLLSTLNFIFMFRYILIVLVVLFSFLDCFISSVLFFFSMFCFCFVAARNQLVGEAVFEAQVGIGKNSECMFVAFSLEALLAEPLHQ